MTRKIEEPTPAYFESSDIDTVMRLNTNLLGEIWLLRDRLAIMERLLSDKAILNKGEIDTYAPDTDMEADLEKLRSQLMERAIKSSNNKAYSVKSLIESAAAR